MPGGKRRGDLSQSLGGGDCPGLFLASVRASLFGPVVAWFFRARLSRSGWTAPAALGLLAPGQSAACLAAVVAAVAAAAATAAASSGPLPGRKARWGWWQRWLCGVFRRRFLFGALSCALPADGKGLLSRPARGHAAARCFLAWCGCAAAFRDRLFRDRAVPGFLAGWRHFPLAASTLQATAALTWQNFWQGGGTFPGDPGPSRATEKGDSVFFFF